jgi:hypothetical protein
MEPIDKISISVNDGNLDDSDGSQKDFGQTSKKTPKETKYGRLNKNHRAKSFRVAKPKLHIMRMQHLDYLDLDEAESPLKGVIKGKTNK